MHESPELAGADMSVLLAVEHARDPLVGQRRRTTHAEGLKKGLLGLIAEERGETVSLAFEEKFSSAKDLLSAASCEKRQLVPNGLGTFLGRGGLEDSGRRHL
jgi:hypothetical protein